MEDLRCQCNKIVAQLKDNMVIIKCRHCKRFIVIKLDEREMGKNKNLKVEYGVEESI